VSGLRVSACSRPWRCYVLRVTGTRDTRQKVPVPVLDTSRGHNEIFLAILDIRVLPVRSTRLYNVSVCLRLSPSVSVSSVCLPLFSICPSVSICPFCPFCPFLSPLSLFVPICPHLSPFVPVCPFLSLFVPFVPFCPFCPFLSPVTNLSEDKIPRRIGSKIKLPLVSGQEASKPGSW
jgi:hypothetical protein